MTRRREMMIALAEALGLEPEQGESTLELAERCIERAEQLSAGQRARELQGDQEQHQREQAARKSRAEAQAEDAAEDEAEQDEPRRVDPSQVAPPKRKRRGRQNEAQAGLGL